MENTNEIKSENEALAPFDGLKLNIKGLALIYEKGGIANLRCPVEAMDNPTAANHKLKLTISSRAEGAEEITVSKITIPDGSLVEINSFDFLTPSRSDFSNVLNIRAEHNSNQIKFVRNIDELSSRVKINGAQMYGSPDSIHSFETWEVINHGMPDESRRRIVDKNNITSSVEGKVRFADPANAQTLITIKSPMNLQAPIIELKLNYSTLTNPTSFIHHTLEINNMCNNEIPNSQAFIECDTKSDFLAYYPLINHSNFGRKLDFVLKRPQGHRAPCNVAFCDTDPE